MERRKWIFALGTIALVVSLIAWFPHLLSRTGIYLTTIFASPSSFNLWQGLGETRTETIRLVVLGGWTGTSFFWRVFYSKTLSGWFALIITWIKRFLKKKQITTQEGHWGRKWPYPFILVLNFIDVCFGLAAAQVLKVNKWYVLGICLFTSTMKNLGYCGVFIVAYHHGLSGWLARILLAGIPFGVTLSILRLLKKLTHNKKTAIPPEAPALAQED
jgi:hypothetical protein